MLGYLWPGYQCYKALECDNRAQLQAWCKYWVIMAAFTAAAPLSDCFLWWVPLYYEAKLAFAVYLWYNGERASERASGVKSSGAVKWAGSGFGRGGGSLGVAPRSNSMCTHEAGRYWLASSSVTSLWL